MNNQPPQRFCTNCGQPLAPHDAFCVSCGTQANVPPMGALGGPLPVGAPRTYPPSYAQAPAQDDPLLAGLAAGYVANRMRRFPFRRSRRRPGARLRGCGCLLLILIIIAGLYIGVTRTTGNLHLILTYAVGGMAILFFLLLFIGMLATRSGREAASEGCLEALFDGFLGGG